MGTMTDEEALRIYPLRDHVLVRQLPAEHLSPGGLIVIPESSQQRPTRGTVLRVGPGRMCETGELVSPAVKEGDTICFSKWSGNGSRGATQADDILLMQESEILGVIES